MSASLSTILFSLPSVRQFLQRISNALAERKSVIVLLPPLIDIKDFRRVFRADLWEKSFSYDEILLSQLEAPEKALDIITKRFDPHYEKRLPRPLSTLLDQIKLPDLVLIHDLENVPDEAKQAWFRFFIEWADASHQRMNQGNLPSALCAIMTAGDFIQKLPSNDLFLDVYWWWGFPSVLEMNMLCRMANDDFEWGLKSQWREAFLPSLSPGDPMLIETLWEMPYVCQEEIIEQLKRYTPSFSWSPADQQIWDEYRTQPLRPSFVQPGISPPKNLQTLWSKGVVYSTQEYGVELHPAVYNCQGIKETVRYRIWRGQINLCLPVIDALRIQICQDLTEYLGPDWPWKWEIPRSEEELEIVKKDPLSTQWGYLVHLLKTNGNFRKYSKWLPAAKIAHELRNQLSHYRTIDMQGMESLMREMEELELKNNGFRH